MKGWLPAAALCLLSPAAWAGNCPVPLPFTLTNGTVADANQVQANFNVTWNCGVDTTNIAITGGSMTNLSSLTAVDNLGTATLDKFLVSEASGPSLNGNTIYNWAFGGGASAYDVNRSVMQMNAGSTVTGMNGYASYVDNELASLAGNSRNGTNFFGVGVAGVNNAWQWGLNTICTDSKTQTVSALTGVNCLGAELDFNIWSTSTVVNGVELVGASGAQPAIANGFVVNTLDISGAARAQWTTAFISANGAASNGLVVGARNASGSNIASQTVLFDVFDNSGVSKAYQMQGTSGAGVSGFNFTHTIAGSVFWAFDSNIEIMDTFALAINFDSLVSAGSHVAAFASGAGITATNIGNNTAAISLLTGNLVYAAPTGTPAASLCLDAGNHIIKKTTAGSCI